MDVVLVTYNSEKWIKDCIHSLEEANKAVHDLKVCIVDNSSKDNTINILNELQKDNCFEDFNVICKKENTGFGSANNVGAYAGQDDIICFINVDTAVYTDTFYKLKERIQNSDKNIGAWEMRQIPYEHPKLYDPVTGETSWMSGAAFAVRRKVFEQIDGFDENIFMYAEDVDLSWRIRANGYKIQYCPEVEILHFSYQKENEVKPVQYVNSLINNLLLRYRFGNWKDILKGHLQFAVVLFGYRSPYLYAKRELFTAYMKHFKHISRFRDTQLKKAQIEKFLEWDYEIIRGGSFYKSERLLQKPLVSIIVRTCQRPDVLRETLISIRNQTYDNIEIVVVEDGKPSAQEMIEAEFNDLNIRYFSTGTNMGRSNAGNLGLENATGEFLNFLDDDDVFYADHVECLVRELQQSGNMAAYAFGFETPIVVYSTKPYKYEIKAYNRRYTTKFDEVELCYHNYIPIQCIMFSRKLYEELGGFDTSLDYLEDWDLWVRYAQRTRFSCVEKTTSMYRVPFDQKIQKTRQDKLDEALKVVRKKHETYNIPVSASRLAVYGKKRIWEK